MSDVKIDFYRFQIKPIYSKCWHLIILLSEKSIEETEGKTILQRKNLLLKFYMTGKKNLRSSSQKTF